MEIVNGWKRIIDEEKKRINNQIKLIFFKRIFLSSIVVLFSFVNK